MQKILKNDDKTKEYLEKLPKIYIVACWAKYGVWDFPFTGKYEINGQGISVPLVYNYYDANGTCDEFRLVGIDTVTTGEIIMWTQNEKIAKRIALLLNKEQQK